MEQNTTFVAGMYLDRVHPNAPEFIITNQTIHVDKLIAWLQEHKQLANEKGYIRLVGKESKTLDEKGNPKRYFQVDTWQPKKEEPTPEQPADAPPF